DWIGWGAVSDVAHARIQGVKLWQAVLSQEEIAAEWDTIAPVRTEDLFDWWDFQGDADSNGHWFGEENSEVLFNSLDGSTFVDDDIDPPGEVEFIPPWAYASNVLIQ